MEDHRGIWCWALSHDTGSLDQVPAKLDLRDGMPVTLYFEDGPGEEIEYDAVLGHIAKPGWESKWMALPDWDTLRRRRIVSNSN